MVTGNLSLIVSQSSARLDIDQVMLKDDNRGCYAEQLGSVHFAQQSAKLNEHTPTYIIAS